MDIKKRINAFIILGKLLRSFLMGNTESKELKQFEDVLQQAVLANGWFTISNVRFAVQSISDNLSKEELEKWLSSYPGLFHYQTKKNIGIVMAGNIPLVGFHDLACVFISGHNAIVKLSSKDDILLKGLINLLMSVAPQFKDRIYFAEGLLKNIDAVIATGSNNSARYFDYYFGKYPHIIRKNRNSVAVITGKETKEELKLLAEDIFLYFGLGCRNISKLFLPQDYKLDHIFKAVFHYKDVLDNHKYQNNYIYNRSVYLMDKIDFFENGFLILKKDMNLASPISVLFYENYNDINHLKSRLEIEKENIQCLVSADKNFDNAVLFGQAQNPKLWDYADNIDTLAFLLSIK